VDGKLNCRRCSGLEVEQDYMLGKHGIDIYLLTYTNIGSGEAFMMANYVCHHTERLSEVGGKDILVRCDTDLNTVTDQSLKHQQYTPIQDTLVSKKVKILAVYPSPSRTLFASNLSDCLGGDFSNLMAGNLNANHVDWKSRAMIPRGKLMLD